MISQKQIEIYTELQEKVDAAKIQFESIKEDFINRLVSGEQVELGKLTIEVKSSERTSVKYKEVLNSLKVIIGEITVTKIRALLEKAITRFLKKYTTIRTQHSLKTSVQSLEKAA